MNHQYIKGNEITYPVSIMFLCLPKTYLIPSTIKVYPHKPINNADELCAVLRNAKSYYEKSPDKLFLDCFTGKSGRFYMVDNYGRKVNPDYIYSMVFCNKKKKQEPVVYPVNQLSCSYGSKIHLGSVFRSPRTAQARRMACMAYNDTEEGYTEPVVRAKRNKNALPTTWDDIWRDTRCNSWKRYRKTQWK